MGSQREVTVNINQTGGIASGDSTVVIKGAQAAYVNPGTIFGGELENMYVTGVSGTTCTIERGWNGSNPEAHADGVDLFINPRFSRYDIAVAINDDLRSLSGQGLFRVGTATIPYNPVFMGYDLSVVPPNFIDILDIRYATATPYRNFPSIKHWKVVRNVTDSVFPSGNGLILYEGAWPGLNMYVTYSAPFLRFNDTTDSVLNTPKVNDETPPLGGYVGTTVPNLTATQLDIPPLGAQIDLVLPREVSRNFMESQPDPQKATDVPAGAVMASVNGLTLKRASRISEEADRLMRQYTRTRGW